jgi:hypothetical protein
VAARGDRGGAWPACHLLFAVELDRGAGLLTYRPININAVQVQWKSGRR